MMNYETRNLTADESATLLRNLTIRLGTHSRAEQALVVIAEMGAGVFMATQSTMKIGERVALKGDEQWTGAVTAVGKGVHVVWDHQPDAGEIESWADELVRIVK